MIRNTSEKDDDAGTEHEEVIILGLKEIEQILVANLCGYTSCEKVGYESPVIESDAVWNGSGVTLTKKVTRKRIVTKEP